MCPLRVMQDGQIEGDNGNAQGSILDNIVRSSELTSRKKITCDSGYLTVDATAARDGKCMQYRPSPFNIHRDAKNVNRKDRLTQPYAVPKSRLASRTPCT